MDMDSQTANIDPSEWSMLECFAYLEGKNIAYEGLENVEEMRERIRQSLQEDQPDSERNNSRQLMEDILSRDKKMKDELLGIYSSLINFVNSDLDRDTASVIEQVYGDFSAVLEKKKEELVSNECPIVVAGETSAGKSSLLNLILGTEVLPHHQLCATSTICRLHNSNNKKIEIVLRNGEIKTEEITGVDDEADEDLKTKLKPYTSSITTREANEYKQVEIYWPIPMLQDRVTIVDTPGVGESEEMTERLFDYLPNAVAFIYVINSANAGGIQQDKLVRILNKQKEWERKGKILPLDYSTAMFVCNKWEIVEDKKEEERVWKDTLQQLKKVIPEISEEQVFKMSVKEEQRFRRLNMATSPKFRQFHDSFTELIPRSLCAKLKRHYKFLDKFLVNLMAKISMRISHAKMTRADQLSLHEKVTTKLEKLKMNSSRVRQDLTSAAMDECNRMVEILLEHVRSPAVQERLLTWRENEVPDMELGDLQVTKLRCENAIAERLMNVLKEVEEERHLVKRATKLLTEKFRKECAVLEDECFTVNLALSGLQEKSFTDESSSASQEIVDYKMSTGEKVGLAISAPVLIPIITALVLALLPVSVGIAATSIYRSIQSMKDYNKNKVTYMQNWTREALKNTFTETNIRHFLFDVYFQNFKSKLDELCVEQIPKQIAAGERQILVISKDFRTSSEILKQYEPMLMKLKDLHDMLKRFEMLYLTKDIIDPRQIKGERDKGNFLSTWKRGNVEMTVSVKVVERNISDSDTTQQLTLDEIEILRSLVHPNIVEVYGLCYILVGDTEKESRLCMVMEHCEDNLEEIVFGNENLQCGFRNYRTNFDRYDAFRFYVLMATGISDGLAEMHRFGFLHRDLRLANVSVKNRTAKLSDFGYANMDSATTGDSYPTRIHLAPEILKLEQYTLKADIYSLGILLWELWYGRRAYTGTDIEASPVDKLLEAIKTGTRPEFSSFLPTNELIDVIKVCWHGDPKKRISASNVSARLRHIFRRYVVEPL